MTAHGYRMHDPFVTPRGLRFMLYSVLALLLAPVVLELSGVLSDYDRYSEAPAAFFAYHAHVIANTSGDVDLLVLGSSTTLTGNDCVYLEELLTQHLGRPAVVTCLGSNWRSEFIFYGILSDFFKRHTVKLVVLEEPREAVADAEHSWTHYFWKPIEFGALLQGLPVRYQLAHYAQSILGVPRHLLSLLRHNDGRGPQRELAAYIAYHGAPPRLLGFKSLLRPDTRQPFQKVDYPVPLIPAEHMIFRGAEHPVLKFKGRRFTDIQARGMQLMKDLTIAQGGHFALLNYSQPEQDKAPLRVRTYDPHAMGGYIPVIGVDPAELYPGFSVDKIRTLWKNESHPNWNGARYNTRALAPAFLDLYDHG